MPHIIQLDRHVADLIAAGEVVERPASAVKELVENAVDAGATQITVEVQNGGMTFLRVTDNGCGIAPEDAPTAFLRHATSKIRTKEDLAAIVNRETNGQGMDVIVMAIGVPALVNSTLKLCKRGGTVNLFAGFAGTGESTIEVNTIHYNEINVNGSTAYKLEDYLAAAEMIKSGKIDADKIVTHHFKIDEFQQAYDVCVAGTGLKVIIEP